MPYRLGFNHPWWPLYVWLLLPLVWVAIWYLGRQSLAALGPVRRWLALALRLLVASLVVLALAELQVVRVSPHLTVIYLLDHSLSVGDEQQGTLLEYISAAIAEQRSQQPQDKAGVIVFGREPAVEIPPLDETQTLTKVETRVDREATNLAGAMKLAQASFPHDTARRLVIISDGNENLGSAQEQVRALLDAGIGIDVVPVPTAARGDVAVEKVTVPQDIRKSEPFSLRVVLNNTTPASEGGGVVEGRLQVFRRAAGAEAGAEQLLVEEPLQLGPGKRVLTYAEKIEHPDFYTYEARFIPRQAAADAQPQNNVAATFTHVRGSGQVLLIEDEDTAGQHDLLVAQLRGQNLEVTVRNSQPQNLFEDLGQLQPFDTVILANVPRERFTDEQVRILVRNTQVMGSGLVMLGGEDSFGAGGWTNTALEEAMPVDFQIKGAEVVPVGALAMIMHASEIPEGNHWQKVVGMEAIRTLGNQDFCGVLHWQGNDQWLWNPGLLPVGANRGRMLALLDRMAPGDMPHFDPGLRMAYQGLMGVKQAGIRHMIIISDGDPTPPSTSLLQTIARAGIKISTVAVGSHGPAESATLKRISDVTKGKYWSVTDPRALPRIYQREARRVARPLVWERREGFTPQIAFPHEMLQGLDPPLPPLTGFVRTSRKESALAEASILSPVPDRAIDNPILASWTYGQGKTVAFTSDAGQRWGAQWTGWSNYQKFFSQLVRWSMRPVDEAGKFSVATDVEDGQLKVVVTALGEDDEYLNFLNIAGSVVGPDMKPLDVELRQVAPGRYVGELPAAQKGNYFVTLTPGAGKAPLRSGVSIPYSEEFRQRQANEGLLAALAAEAPRGGPPGKVIAAPPAVQDPRQRLAELLKVDTFRHDLPRATSSQDVWHLLVLLGSCLFFCDLFTRRVAVNLGWVVPLAGRARDLLLRRTPAPAAAPVLDRLRSRKAEVAEQIEQRRTAAARFEPSPDAAAGPLETAEPETAPPADAPRSAAPPVEDEETYTNRLLRAKQRVWEERKENS